MLPFQRQMYVIYSNSYRIVRDLEIMYGRFMLEDPRIATVDEIVDIKVQKQTATSYLIACNDASWLTTKPIKEVEHILSASKKYPDNILSFHGAAIECNGRLYVLLGPTMCGKSTLTCYLTTKGCGYVSEDSILIDKQTFCVYPFDRPLRLRQGGYDVLTSMNIPLENCEIVTSEDWLRYVFTPSLCVTDALPVHKILFIMRGKINSIYNLSTVSAVQKLMLSPLFDYPITCEYILWLKQFASDKCFSIMYKDMEYLYNLIVNESI